MIPTQPCSTLNRSGMLSQSHILVPCASIFLEFVIIGPSCGVDPILGFWKFWNSRNWSYWSAYVPTPIFRNIVIRVTQSTDLAKSLKTWCGGPRTMPGARRTNLSKCQANREIWAILDEITTGQGKNLSKCYFPLMILYKKKCSKKNCASFIVYQNSFKWLYIAYATHKTYFQ